MRTSEASGCGLIWMYYRFSTDKVFVSPCLPHRECNVLFSTYANSCVFSTAEHSKRGFASINRYRRRVAEMVSSREWFLGAVSAFVALGLPLITECHASKLNNVLVFISDDLSPFHLDPQHPAKMPNMDQLATRGIKFTNAHTSFPVCGPSRMSFMTGRYAESTKLFTFERYVMQVPGLTTMAQYLARNHGYETIAFGKVFHEDHDPNCPVAQAMYQSGLWTERQRGGGSEDGECRFNWFCNKPLGASGDARLSDTVVSYLSKRNKSRPLAAFIGFRKPHLDVGLPPGYLNKLDEGNFTDRMLLSEPSSLGKNNTVIPFRDSLQRFDCYYEIARRRINKKKAYPTSFLLEKNGQDDLREMRRYYFAAIRFVDDMIARVVSFIDASPDYKDNTAIVYFADHGFAMSEHGMFCKNALFEQQTRVPLVVVPARRERFPGNRVRTDPVGLVDIFPTVIRVATGNVLPNNAIVDSSGLPLSGRSLLGSRSQISTYTFSMYPRCASVSGKSNWQCINAVQKCGRIANKWMGYMVRTSTQRYVEWRNFRDVVIGCAQPSWSGLTRQIRNRMPKVKQIDPNKTGGIWDELPVQRELFTGYSDAPKIKWNDWEQSNALVDEKQNQGTIRNALEFSAAIKWRFDPTFAPDGVDQPCSGNGFVRLKNPSAGWDLLRDPQWSDIECACLSDWSGGLCQVYSPNP